MPPSPESRPALAPADTPAAGTDLALARRVLETEAAAILGLVDRLDGAFSAAVERVVDCRGRVITTGMGKSGIICRKLAATLSSTGTPAFFLHPAEAVHGDLGVITSHDVVIAVSQGGETAEVLRVLEFIRRIGATLVSITGAPRSTLARSSDVALDCGVSEEACPMNLAPTASTTAALALGDALAMAVLVRKGFRAEDFASLHPGGSLGKRLLRADRLMHTGDQMPRVALDTLMREVVAEMSRKGLGMTCVVDAGGRLAGVITDGDLRRHIMRTGDLLARSAADVMTHGAVTVPPEIFAVEALKILEERKISSLVVVDAARRPLGVLHLHDLWRTEMF